MPNNTYAFGDLNPVLSPAVSRNMDTSMSVMDILREVIIAHYKTNSMMGTGPYKGYVLRVEEDMDQNNPAPGNWLATVFGEQGLFDGLEAPKVLKRYKVRIPEIHVTLPIPAQVAQSATETGAHQPIIDMYPTFVAMTSNAEVAAPGDLVWVDFGHRGNLEDPTFIAPIFPPTENAPADNTPPSESHRDPCPPSSENPGDPPNRRGRRNPPNRRNRRRRGERGRDRAPESGGPVGGGQQEFVSDDPSSNWLYRPIRDIARHNNAQQCRSRGTSQAVVTEQSRKGCSFSSFWGMNVTLNRRGVPGPNEYLQEGGNGRAVSGRLAAGSCKDISNMLAKYLTAYRIAAEDQGGTPYSWGGKGASRTNRKQGRDPAWNTGLDCSGYARVVRVVAEGLMHENGSLGNAYRLKQATRVEGLSGSTRYRVTGTSSDTYHWSYQAYRNPFHRWARAGRYEAHWLASSVRSPDGLSTSRKKKIMWGGNITEDGYTWFCPVDAVANNISVKDPSGNLYKDFMQRLTTDGGRRNLSYKELSSSEQSRVHIMPGDFLGTGNGYGRESALTHVVFAFVGPSGELRIGESGGPYNGTGSMLASEWLSRQRKQGLYIWQPPEWGRVWASVGGRPDQAWTPELCRTLAGNEYFQNVRQRAVASGETQTEALTSSPRIGYGAPIRVPPSQSQTEGATSESEPNADQDGDIVSADSATATTAEETAPEAVEVDPAPGTSATSFLSQELLAQLNQDGSLQNTEYLGNYTEAECAEMMRMAFRNIESPGYDELNPESRQFWGEITVNNITRQMALDFAIAPHETADVLRCGCSQTALLSTIAGDRAVAASDGIRNAFRNCPPDVDPPFGLLFGSQLDSRRGSAGGAAGEAQASSPAASNSASQSGGARPRVSRRPNGQPCPERNPSDQPQRRGGGDGGGGGPAVNPPPDPNPLDGERPGNPINTNNVQYSEYLGTLGAPTEYNGSQMTFVKPGFTRTPEGILPAYHAGANAKVPQWGQPNLAQVVQVVTELGGALPTSGTSRGLSSTVTSSRSDTSLHYGQIAVDVQTNSMGAYRSAGNVAALETDMYVAEWDQRRGRDRMVVWVRSTRQSGEVTRQGNGKTETFRVEHKTLNAIRRTGGAPVPEAPVTGYFINLTKIMEAYGLEGIGPRNNWRTRGGNGMSMEGWHFDYRNNANMVHGQTTFGSFLDTRYPRSQSDTSSAGTPRNRGKLWRGGYFS